MTGNKNQQPTTSLMLLEVLSNATEDAIMLHDFTHVLELNKAAANLFNRPAHKIKGAPLLSVVPEDITSQLQLSKKEFEKEIFIEVEGEIKHYTVKATDLNVSETCIQTITFRDITPLKHTSEKLKEAKNFEQQAHRLAQLGCWSYHFDTDQLEWSDAMYDITGQPREYGPWVDYDMEMYHPDDLYKLFSLFDDPFNIDYPWHKEYRIIRRDGEIRHIQGVVQLIYDKHAKPEKLIGTALDITSLKQTQQALKTSESRLRAIIESTSDLFIILKGNMIDYVSPAIQHIGNYSPSEILFQDYLQFIHPDDRQTVQNNLNKAQQQEENTVIVPECRMRNKAGHYITTELIAKAMYSNPGIDGIVITIRDITERVKHEAEQSRLKQELFQAKKLESIGRLAGGIAHDFKNILMPIKGYADLIQEKLHKGMNTPESELNEISYIKKAAENADELVQQILTFGRRATLHKTSFNVSQLIKESLNILAPTIPSDIKVNVFCDDDENSHLNADFTQLKQVMMNLLTNAIQAMPHGGTLDICASIADASLSNNDDIVISIKDTGKGIPEDFIDKIFDPFFTTRKEQNGNGLGLSVVQGIVKNHNGHINVQSKTGQGTCFSIYLPQTVSFSADKHGNYPFQDERPVTEANILLVEDDEMNRSLIHQILKKSGYHVVSFGTGDEAINYLHKHNNIQLVITDFSMPGTCGTALAKVIKKEHQLPVILLSGSAQKDFIEVSNKYIDAFILKPVSAKELLQQVLLFIPCTA